MELRNHILAVFFGARCLIERSTSPLIPFYIMAEFLRPEPQFCALLFGELVEALFEF